MRWQRGQGTCPGRQCLSSIPVNYELLPWRNLCHTNLRLLLLLLKTTGLGLTRLRLELAATPCMAGAASLERREKLLETRGERETCFLLLLLSVGGENGAQRASSLTGGGVGQPLLRAPAGDPLLQRVEEGLGDVEHQRLWFACTNKNEKSG